jgi:hypothetical protein
MYAGESAVLADSSGQAEVSDVRRTGLVEENVPGLQVAVQYAPLVGVVNRPRNHRD